MFLNMTMDPKLIRPYGELPGFINSSSEMRRAHHATYITSRLARFRSSRNRADSRSRLSGSGSRSR